MKKETLARTVAVAALVYGAYWILWRWTNTINTEPRAIVPSLVLMLAETWAYLSSCMFVLLVWNIKKRDPGPPPRGRAVDVFITCYDEPLEVLRRTAIGAVNIKYPHRTYMLDDGKREDVLGMCNELGIGYIRRTGNKNAKAGNLNFALSVTHGEFILQLDSDHVPLPNIVHRMLGHFNDPKVAVIQSPQDFYNVDSFTHVVNDDGRRLWEENRIFYSLIQPGRDHWGASFFCGSCGMLRRSALESIGGFSTQTIIEDMETTMELHARGWKSVYHNETLAYGLSPGTASAYHVQRLRWGQGAMQILRKLKPLTRKGLTLPQRLNYFAGTATYLEGWQKAVFYLMPLLFLYSGILPVSGNEREFLLRLFPYLVLSIASFELLSRGTGYLLLAERYTMVRFFTYMLAVSGYFARKPLKFNVTPKGKTGVPFHTYAPQTVLFVLSLLAPIWAALAYWRGWVNYDVRNWNALAFWVNGLWVLWNCYFAGYVVRHSLKMRQQRDDHRFSERFPIKVRIENAGAGVRKAVHALTSDLNPAGLGFRSVERLDTGTLVSMQLPLTTGNVKVSGEVRYVSEDTTATGPVYVHGVVFQDVPIEVRDSIELHCTHHAMPMWRLRYRQSIDIVTRTSEAFSNTRKERRSKVQLPVRIKLQSVPAGEPQPQARTMILEEMNKHGAQLIADSPLSPGTELMFETHGGGITGSGTVRYVQVHETSMAVLFTLGVELTAA